MEAGGRNRKAHRVGQTAASGRSANARATGQTAQRRTRHQTRADCVARASQKQTHSGTTRETDGTAPPRELINEKLRPAPTRIQFSFNTGRAYDHTEKFVSCRVPAASDSAGAARNK